MGKASKIIKECLKEQNMSQHELAEKLNEKPQYINQQLNRSSDMKVERFVDVLDKIGYQVEVTEKK